jgi:hypothetical protein
VKGHKKSWADAVLWSFLVAVVVTGAVHALALTLPNMLSAGSARQMSGFERFAHKFSETWLVNVGVLAAAVAGGSFLLSLPLFLARVRAANRRDSGAELAPPPPGNS